MPGVVLESLSRRFGPVAAVDQINLTVKDGEFLTLLGPSGCGKTTTLRMVAGLDQNDGGRISIGDKVVSDSEKKFFVPPEKRDLGMVFQSYAIWPHMTVFDNVAYPLKIRRRPRAEIKDKVTKALRLVEMENYADRPAPKLSGGQQQRVAIARALVFEPQVLLLDEPLSNLDAKLRTQMGDEFRLLQKRLNITTLYVTHDQEEAMALSDRVVVMRSGKILQQGDPEALYTRPNSRDVAAFFGSPNFMEGKVTNCVKSNTGTDYRLTVEGKGWGGQCVSERAFNVGDNVVVVVRPENIAVAPPGTAPVNGEIVWKGNLQHAIFRGSKRSIQVTVGDTLLNVEAPTLQSNTLGDSVTLIAKPEGAWALPN